MPALRSNSLRLVLSVAVCLASVASAFRPGTTSAVAACPISMPVPLRMLYRASERIVVARVGNSAPEKSGDSDDSYRRTTFHVSESLKGDPSENTFQVVHWTSSDVPDYEGNFKKGDTLLLFLNRIENDHAYRVDDIGYGVKKLSDDDLKIYLRRIEELAAIMQKEKPDEAETVEWLVRCAEEPATRWEGAYELNASLSLARSEAAKKGDPTATANGEAEGEEAGETDESEAAAESVEVEEAATTETGGAASEAAEETSPDVEASAEESANEEAVNIVTKLNARTLRFGGYGTDIGPEPVNGLTPDQKARLADALFRADKFGRGETALLNVVKGWGDARLVPFLAGQLRGLEKDPPYFADELMNVLAHALKDKNLRQLVENYSANAPYQDYFEGEDEQEEELGEEGEAEKRARAVTEGKTKISAVQKRSEMLREFLAAVENRIQYDLAMQLSR
ncbi:MAG: hypothetical protein LC802_09665 [Acidobacteria bacterium]|nr:hypothetical protein [Acidobacteriota bacterium]